MSEGGGELVTSNEPAVFTESLLDKIVVEDSKRDGRLANSASTNESEWGVVFCQTDNLLDQLVSSKKGPRWRWR